MKIVCLVAIYLLSYHGFTQALSDQETLEVVTWNLQWFGHHHPDSKKDKGPKYEELQVKNAVKVIEAMGKPDLILFQEITANNFFRELAQTLGYRYFLSPGSEGKQRIGLFHNDQVTSIGEPQQILVNKKNSLHKDPRYWQNSVIRQWVSFTSWAFISRPIGRRLRKMKKLKAGKGEKRRQN